jgi:hypothetical protein
MSFAFAVVVPAAAAQNAPPKPESDCGLTEMCRRVTNAGETHVSGRVVELLLFAVVVALVALGYRITVARQAARGID